MKAVLSLDDAKVHVDVLRTRIDHLGQFMAVIAARIAFHKSADVFRRLVDTAIRSCEIEPVEIARAFEVNTGTISRWRSGKNAPHTSVRPFIIEWIRKTISDNVTVLSDELRQAEEEVRKLTPEEPHPVRAGRRVAAR